MSKYVLYEGKAYEVFGNDQCIFSGDIRLIGIHPSRAVHISKCTQITEAEYHARKLLECEKGEFGPHTWEQVNAFIKQCESERKPKPEVTERHIGCLVEMMYDDGNVGHPWMMEHYERGAAQGQYTERRLPRQPVPLAFHKHDGSSDIPEWINSEDFLVYYDYKGIRGCMVVEGLTDFKWVKSFAVIKPVLPE